MPAPEDNIMRPRNIALLIIVAAVIGALVFWLAPHGNPPVHLAAENCDAALWSHTYLPERLKVLDACVAVEGEVRQMHSESDGDMHIRLRVDEKRALNYVNRLHLNGDIVVEAVCEHAPKGEAATAACAGYESHVSIPHVGDRVRVTGSWVVDRENGWTEIHPVTLIEVLR
jgi:hypothetical protein